LPSIQGNGARTAFFNTGTDQAFNVVMDYGGMNRIIRVMGYVYDFYPSTGARINDEA